MAKTKTQKRFEACVRFLQKNPTSKMFFDVSYENTLKKLPHDAQEKLESIRKGQQ